MNAEDIALMIVIPFIVSFVLAFNSSTRPILFGFLILLTFALLASIEAEAGEFHDDYLYFEMKAGTFIDGCRSCPEPDGDIPALISIGYEWVSDNLDVGVEVLHRSNYDIGWPRPGQTGREEYDRNGVFAKLKYKFR